MWFVSPPEIITFEEALLCFPRIKKSYKSYIDTSFPEINFEQLSTRSAKMLHPLIKDYIGNILLVGHGATLQQISNLLVGQPVLINKRMCALNKFDYVEGTWIHTYSSADHLSYEENNAEVEAIMAKEKHFLQKI